jgi:hypothetical protein
VTEKTYLHSDLSIQNHPIWKLPGFWETAVKEDIFQQLNKSPVSPWDELSSEALREAVVNIHTMVFGQLGSLSMSMMEQGFSKSEVITMIHDLTLFSFHFLFYFLLQVVHQIKILSKKFQLTEEQEFELLTNITGQTIKQYVAPPVIATKNMNINTINVTSKPTVGSLSPTARSMAVKIETDKNNTTNDSISQNMDDLVVVEGTVIEQQPPADGTSVVPRSSRSNRSRSTSGQDNNSVTSPPPIMNGETRSPKPQSPMKRPSQGQVLHIQNPGEATPSQTLHSPPPKSLSSATAAAKNSSEPEASTSLPQPQPPQQPQTMMEPELSTTQQQQERVSKRSQLKSFFSSFSKGPNNPTQATPTTATGATVTTTISTSTANRSKQPPSATNNFDDDFAVL